MQFAWRLASPSQSRAGMSPVRMRASPISPQTWIKLSTVIETGLTKKRMACWASRFDNAAVGTNPAATLIWNPDKNFIVRFLLVCD